MALIRNFLLIFIVCQLFRELGANEGCISIEQVGYGLLYRPVTLNCVVLKSDDVNENLFVHWYSGSKSEKKNTLLGSFFRVKGVPSFDDQVGKNPGISFSWDNSRQTLSLTVKNLTMEDDALNKDWTCEINSASCNFDTAIHEIDVEVSPSVPIMSGVDAIWVDGAIEYVLHCAVKRPKPEAEVYWLIDGVKHNPTNTSIGDGGKGFSKTAVTLSHKFNTSIARQQLSCAVKWMDEVGIFTYKTVAVYYKPRVSVEPEDGQSDPIEGSRFTLLCASDARPKVPCQRTRLLQGNYKWWRDGVLLSTKANCKLTQTLNHTQHSGVYTCAARNTAGTGRDVQGYKLTVQYLSSVGLHRFLTNPVTEGNETSAKCEIQDGFPERIKSIVWRNDGTIVKDDGDRMLLDETITFTKAKKDYAGYYTCTITTNGGTQESNQQYIEVHFAPRGAPTFGISENPAALNENITLTCGKDSVCGWPKNYNYSFYMDKKLITNSESDQLVLPAIAGVYSCIISNSAGQSLSSERKLTIAEHGVGYIATVTVFCMGALILLTATALCIKQQYRKAKERGKPI